MFRHLRISLTVVAFMTLAAGVLVVALANAGTGSCEGTRIALLTHTSTRSGDVIAKTGVYDNGTRICAVSVKQGYFYGKDTWMSLTLFKTGTTPDSDTGTFLYQAGPVRKNRDGCVNVELDMRNLQGQLILQDYRGICA